MQAPIDVVHEFTTGFVVHDDPPIADRTLHANACGITGLTPTGPIGGCEAYQASLDACATAFRAVAPLEILAYFATGDRVVARVRITTAAQEASTDG
jgi:hypothetical protein